MVGSFNFSHIFPFPSKGRSQLPFWCFNGGVFDLLLRVLGSGGLGKWSVVHKVGISMNLLKWKLTDRMGPGCCFWAVVDFLHCITLQQFQRDGRNTCLWVRSCFPGRGKQEQGTSQALKVQRSDKPKHLLFLFLLLFLALASVHHSIFLVHPSFQMLQIYFPTVQLPTHAWQRSYESKMNTQVHAMQVPSERRSEHFGKRPSHFAGVLRRQ